MTAFASQDGGDMTAKTTTLQKLPSLDRRAKELIDDLLCGAVYREEERLGRRLSGAEVEALELQTFEPIMLWRAPKKSNRSVPVMTPPELRTLAQQARLLAALLSEIERDRLLLKAERVEAEACELEGRGDERGSIS